MHLVVIVWQCCWIPGRRLGLCCNDFSCLVLTVRFALVTVVMLFVCGFGLLL